MGSCELLHYSKQHNQCSVLLSYCLYWSLNNRAGMGRTGDTTSSACCGQLWMLMESDRNKAGIYSFFRLQEKEEKKKKTTSGLTYSHQLNVSKTF